MSYSTGSLTLPENNRKGLTLGYIIERAQLSNGMQSACHKVYEI